MSEYSMGLNSFNLDYLPGFNTGAYSLGGGFFGTGGVTMPDFYSTGGLFPLNTNNFLMPEFSTFGSFDPFGLSSPGFNSMQLFFEAQQWQNMVTQMWTNLMDIAQNYKLPEFNFNFNFNSGKTGGSRGYGNYNQKATDLYKGTAEDLNKHLKGVMAGKGKKLLELQNKYGISAAFMAAVINNESAHGTSDYAVDYNNVAGIMSPASNYKNPKVFNSVDECLEEFAKNIRNNYVNKGRVTISQIYEKYCPIGADNDPDGMNFGWGKTVSDLMDKYNNLA